MFSFYLKVFLLERLLFECLLHLKVNETSKKYFIHFINMEKAGLGN